MNMDCMKNTPRSMNRQRGFNISCSSSIVLQTLIIGIYISTISAGLVHSDTTETTTYPTPSIPPNKNTVTTYDECKRYLCKYGYVTCDCKQQLVRKRRQLQDGLFPTEYNPDSDSANPDNKVADETDRRPPNTDDKLLACVDSDFTLGLKSFQENYRLPITGLCDVNTTKQMSQRRCGQPDTVIDKLDGEVAEEEVVVRKTRSLSDIIAEKSRLEKAKARNKEIFNEYMQDIMDEEKNPLMEIHRVKRSSLYSSSIDYGEHVTSGFTKTRVSWRLPRNFRYMFIPEYEQRAIMRVAFRYWSAVAPLCFYEDRISDIEHVDIKIGFLDRVHLQCSRPFDGYGGEIAHKFVYDVHFDKSESYTIDTELDSSTRLSLLLVAAHEIGHLLGLNHSTQTTSVMNAIYHHYLDGNFQLSAHDKREVTIKYGHCKGSFDSVFDYVRTDKDSERRIYNSYFFRADHAWKYQNNLQSTTDGDPVRISNTWGTDLRNIDTFLHYFKYDTSTAKFYDEHIFFKGFRYYRYDSQTNRVAESGLISQKYPAHNSTYAIPSHLDAAFYDSRRKVNLIYFFKGSKVYSYNYQPGGSHQCCTSIQSIAELFPLAAGETENSYKDGIDTVYFSNTKRSLYFIKGDKVWVNELYVSSSQNNRMKYVGNWYDLWYYICDADCPT